MRAVCQARSSSLKLASARVSIQGLAEFIASLPFDKRAQRAPSLDQFDPRFLTNAFTSMPRSRRAWSKLMQWGYECRVHVAVALANA
ncbi:hypothetical protein L1887_48390 [Cichorium endivia]|nr:hypothetical protein L1887_48390 [Cichorium endivia]